MRDAQSLLDQLLSFGSEKLTAEQVHQLLGTANEERIAGLAGAVLDKNAARALEIVGQTVDQGLQLGELLDQLIEYWRDLMVVQCTGDESQILSVTGQHCQALKQQAGRLKPDTVLAGLDILVDGPNPAARHQPGPGAGGDGPGSFEPAGRSGVAGAAGAMGGVARSPACWLPVNRPAQPARAAAAAESTPGLPVAPANSAPVESRKKKG